MKEEEVCLRYVICTYVRRLICCFFIIHISDVKNLISSFYSKKIYKFGTRPNNLQISIQNKFDLAQFVYVLFLPSKLDTIQYSVFFFSKKRHSMVSLVFHYSFYLRCAIRKHFSKFQKRKWLNISAVSVPWY